MQRHPELDFVGVDDFSGGRKAAEYLIARGHRRLGFLGNSLMKTSSERCCGFERVVAASMGASTVTIETESDETYNAQIDKLCNVNGVFDGDGYFTYNKIRGKNRSIQGGYTSKSENIAR